MRCNLNEKLCKTIITYFVYSLNGYYRLMHCINMILLQRYQKCPEFNW